MSSLYFLSELNTEPNSEAPIRLAPAEDNFSTVCLFYACAKSLQASHLCDIDRQTRALVSVCADLMCLVQLTTGKLAVIRQVAGPARAHYIE